MAQPGVDLSLPPAPTLASRSLLTIFVSICSYRDPETLPTLASLYSNATHPSRVHCGVVWQVDPSSDTFAFLPSPPPPTPSTHLRCLYLPHTSARGPLYARHLARRLYAGQHFFLQIDSHTRLSPGWDVSLLDQLYAAASIVPSDTPVYLTGYPSGYHPSQPPPPPSTNVMAASHFAADGLLRLKALPLHASCPQRPLLRCLHAAAGWFFVAAGWLALAEVPVSAFPFLFFGEELLLGLQAWDVGLRRLPHAAARGAALLGQGIQTGLEGGGGAGGRGREGGEGEGGAHLQGRGGRGLAGAGEDGGGVLGGDRSGLGGAQRLGQRQEGRGGGVAAGASAGCTKRGGVAASAGLRRIAMRVMPILFPAVT